MADDITAEIKAEIEKYIISNEEARSIINKYATIYSINRAGIRAHLSIQITAMLATYDKKTGEPLLNFTTIAHDKNKIEANDFFRVETINEKESLGIPINSKKAINEIANRVADNLIGAFNSWNGKVIKGVLCTKITNKAAYGIKGQSTAFRLTQEDPNNPVDIYDVMRKHVREPLNSAIQILRSYSPTGNIQVGYVFNHGHMFNSSASMRGKVIELYKKIEEAGTMTTSDMVKFKTMITKYVNQGTDPVKEVYEEKNVNVNYKRRTKIDNKVYDEHEIFLELQSKKFNIALSSVEKKALDKILDKIVKYLEGRWDTIKSSPDIVKRVALKTLQDTTDSLRVSFGQAKKHGNTNYSKKIKQNNKINLNKGSRRPGRKPKAPTVKVPTRSGGVADVTSNLVLLKNIINEHLPDYVQKNMGKGAAKEILNYRTGRFAKSAELKTLAQVKGSKSFVLDGLVTYMRNPYDVFRPGGKLHKPGRDPKRIIDKSIRQILKEKALIALSFKSQVG